MYALKGKIALCAMNQLNTLSSFSDLLEGLRYFV